MNTTHRHIGVEFYQTIENMRVKKDKNQEENIQKLYSNINDINKACIELIEEDVEKWERENPKLKDKTYLFTENRSGFRFPKEINESEEREKKAASKYRPYSFVEYSSKNVRDGSKEYYTNRRNMETLIAFCAAKNLKLDIEQLLEIVHFFVCFPITTRQEEQWANKDLEKRRYDKYVMFYEYIIEPTYENNVDTFSSIEDCFVKIAREFNQIDTLYMDYKEKLQFYREFEYAKDLPINIYCQVKYGKSFRPNDYDKSEYDYILEIKKQPHTYLTTLKEYKGKLNVKQR